ncbi:hypothetical protein HDU98_004171 [Podochytrium sp. JEL0797]|nr:hypothetical protein HDU98_004171 [Podochytrium sp. JEL0797]
MSTEPHLDDFFNPWRPPPIHSIPHDLFFTTATLSSGSLETQILAHVDATTPFLISTSTPDAKCFAIATPDGQCIYKYELSKGNSEFRITGAQGKATPVSPSPFFPGVVKLAKEASFRNPYKQTHFKYAWIQKTSTLFVLEKQEASKFSGKPGVRIAELRVLLVDDESSRGGSSSEKKERQMEAKLSSVGEYVEWQSLKELAFFVGTCVAARS